MKKSVLNELRKFQKELEKGEYTPHFLVGVDMCEDGTPQSTMMISKSKPFEAVGMIDLLIQNLQDTKKDILKGLSQKTVRAKKEDGKDLNTLLNKLPQGLKDKVLDLKNRMDKAMDSQDLEEVQKIKKELEELNPYSFMKDHEQDDKKDDEDFNIDDFKGSIS